jgi:hypothetical protein
MGQLSKLTKHLTLIKSRLQELEEGWASDSLDNMRKIDYLHGRSLLLKNIEKLESELKTFYKKDQIIKVSSPIKENGRMVIKEIYFTGLDATEALYIANLILTKEYGSPGETLYHEIIPTGRILTKSTFS